MPSQAANAAALRADGHQMQVYLSKMVDVANPVLVGTVSAAADTVSETAIAYTTTSGSSSSVRRGMRVHLYTSGGVFKGLLSVRFAGTISSTSLPVREFSEGHVQVVAGDILKVFNDFVLTDRLVAAIETFDPDYETYSAQNGTVKPIACSGGWWAGFVDSGQTYATVTLNGSESYTGDEDSSGSVIHLWTLPSGVTFAPGSGSTDAAPTVRVTAGYYVIEHTVTDSSNSQSEVSYVPVCAHDSSHTPYELTLDSAIQGDPARGFNLSVALYENADLLSLPDLCPVVVWTRETLNGSVQSIGHKVSGRSHILAVGYLRRSRVPITSEGDIVRFDIIAPLARLFELPGFSKVMDRNASPDAWSEIEALTIRRGILQLARYYTNAPQLVDLVFDGFSDVDYPALYLQKKTPGDQIIELADGRGARLTTDQTGRLEVQHRLDLTPLDERSGVTTCYTFTADDCISVEVELEGARVVETHKGRGYTAGVSTAETQPIFAKWAASPGTGSATPASDRLVVVDAAEMYEQLAMRGAAEDQIFVDANGAQSFAPQATLVLPGSYWGLFRNYREYYLLDLDETTNARGVDLTAFRYMLESVALEVTAEGAGQVRAVFQAATYGTGAVDDPAEALTQTITQPNYSYPEPVSFGGGGSEFLLGRGTYNLGFIADDGYLYLGDTRPTLPVWERYSLASLGMAGTPVMYIVDAFDFANGVLVTSTKGYRALDIGSLSRSLNNEYAFRYTSALRSLQSERGLQGFFVCASHQDDGKVDVDYTLDSGVNWSRNQDIGGSWVGGSGDGTRPGVYVFAGTAGKVLISAFTGTGSTTNGRLKVSTNNGATFTDFDSNTFLILAEDIHCPFQDESIAYHGRPTSGGSYVAYRLYKTVGGVATNISPSDGVESYGPINQFGVKSCDVDKASILCAGSNRDTGTVKYGVWLARDGGLAAASFQTLISPTTTVPYRAVAFAGDDPNTCWLWGTGGAIAQCKNLNATAPLIRDLSGNLSSFTSPAVGRILNIFGV